MTRNVTPLNLFESPARRPVEHEDAAPRRCPPEWLASPLALDAISATNDQRQWIRCVMRQATGEERAPRGVAQQLRRERETLLCTPSCDLARIRQIEMALTELRHAARERRTQALRNAAAVLSAEQRSKLTLRFVREWEHRQCMGDKRGTTERTSSQTADGGRAHRGISAAG